MNRKAIIGWTGLAFIAGLSLYSCAAKSDGYEGSLKDGTVTQYRVEPLSSRRRSDVRDYLTASERRILKRIHADASARREGRRVRNARVASYRDEPIPVRYVERRNAPSSLYVRSDGKECRAAIKAVSEHRAWQGRALGNAIDKWRAMAIAEHGYSWGRYNNARAERPDCGPIYTNKLGKDIWVCTVRARPCRDL